jgi:hypothetical protein
MNGKGVVMGRTLGVMVTITTYGMWLRGDQRGWVDEGRILPPDPQLHEADRQRLKHPPLRFDAAQQHIVGNAIAHAIHCDIEATLYALAVEDWHTHAVIGACDAPIGHVVKTMKEAARYALKLGRPLWADGYDKRWCFDPASLRARIAYVDRHNTRRNLPAQRFAHITPLPPI